MISRLKKILDKFDGAFITSPHNLRYFSGFTGGEGYALITSNKKYLFTDSRYTEQAEKECLDFEIIRLGNLSELFLEKVIDDKIKTLAFEDKFMSFAEFKGISESLKSITFFGASDDFDRCRMVKTEKEIEMLKKAEKIGCIAFEKILDIIKPGVTENEIALEIDYFMRKCGASGNSFETIAVSGKKSSLPHGKPSDKKVENGEFLTMDFGCIYNGYCSDMTRTIVVGKASGEQKKIYETVRQAQMAGLEFIRAGVSAKDADYSARKIIEDNGYGKYFGHSLGHGVGLCIHELPNLSPRSEIILEENMIVTCEPGIYVPDFGGVRIEDMLCVKKNGIENLTFCDKRLIEI